MGLFSGLLGKAGVLGAEALTQSYGGLLVDGEGIEIGFVVIRDTLVFTDRRLILVDVQGLTGSKIGYLSIPYSRITRFGVETAGAFDLDAELKLWVSGDSEPVCWKFNRKVDIHDVQKVLARHVLV